MSSFVLRLAEVTQIIMKTTGECLSAETIEAWLSSHGSHGIKPKMVTISDQNWVSKGFMEHL